MLLNSVVLTWFAFFALGLSTYMGAAIFKAIGDGGGFLGPTFNVVGESLRYCVVMILMAIITTVMAAPLFKKIYGRHLASISDNSALAT